MTRNIGTIVRNCNTATGEQGVQLPLKAIRDGYFITPYPISFQSLNSEQVEVFLI